MAKQRLRNLVAAGDRFIITAEYVPLPGHNLANFKKFLKGYAEKKSQVPDDMVVGCVTIPQSPGGVASMSPADIYALLDKEGLWDDLDVMPHVTTKDHNADAIETYLVGLRKLGLETVLALTGDKPTKAKGVFEYDSIGLIDFLKEMNNQEFEKASPGEFDSVHQFYIAAAVSPFKYTEPSQMQQYYKMTKKLRSGADCLMTQVGWDCRKSQELFAYLKEQRLDVPVFGNVYFLTTMTPAPRLMHEGKLPGCVVTKKLFDTLRSESPEQHLERAALQVAMYRDLGAVGVDLGGIFDFDMLLDIVKKAKEIGPHWREHQARLNYGVEGGWYLYNEDGSRKTLSRPRKKLSKRNYDSFHYMLFTPGKGIRGPVKKLFGLSKGLREGKGALTTAFHSLFEKPMKSLLFHCEECGDCQLSENFSICTIGRCEKGLDNAPCGDANPDGTCGNNVEIPCVGELIYQAAASEGPDGLQNLARRINPNRNPQLEGTCSILNNFFDRDHCRTVPLIQIGNTINAFLPKVGAAMQELLDKGDRAYDQPSGALAFLISLINGQAKHHAEYVAVNVDKFKDQAPNLMKHYVQLVKKHGLGQAVCIESRNPVVLKAGLEQWYTGPEAQSLPLPLVQSVTAETIHEVLPALKPIGPFKIVARLEATQPQNNGQVTADELHQQARKIFTAAVQEFGLKPQDVFFELPVTPLMDDLPAPDSKPSQTYHSFEAIGKIIKDSSLKGSHTTFTAMLSTRKVPGRTVGVCRAYVAQGQKYGIDSVMVDTRQDFGLTPAAPDLIDLVDAFARQNGSPPAAQQAKEKLDAFVAANQKAKR